MDDAEIPAQLVAPLRVVVDEAGNPVCKSAPGSKSKGGFLAGAVAVPEVLADSLLPLLPRDPQGRLLKSSSKELSPSRLLDFLNALPIDRISIAIVGLATNSAVNEDITIKAEEIANYWRRDHHHKTISRSNLLRLRVDTEAILNAWVLHSKRQLVAAKKRRIESQSVLTPAEDWAVSDGDLEQKVSFMSVTIDEGNHDSSTRRNAPGWFQESLARRSVIVPLGLRRRRAPTRHLGSACRDDPSSWGEARPTGCHALAQSRAPGGERLPPRRDDNPAP